MKCWAAAMGLLAALALPALGQHSSAHGGMAGHGGPAGHVGSSGHSAFTGRSSFAGHAGFASRPGFGGHAGFAGHPRYPGGRAGFARNWNGGWPSGARGYGSFTTPGLIPGLPAQSGYRVPYRGYGAGQHRAPYRPGFGDHRRGRDRDHDRERHGWNGGYGYAGVYPGLVYPPYPFVVDPGFYDWGDSGDYSDGPGGGVQGEAPGYAPYSADNAAPYGYENQPAGPVPYDEPSATVEQPQYRQAPAARARVAYEGTTPPAVEEELTVLFKDGRAPEKMRNYMMNSRTLTDMDPQHYQRIPLDQIDIAATTEVNRAKGLDFSVPGATSE